ncbi:Golgi membrane exchange factor (Ric1p-Rgp1p) subunit [Malassezia sp. CBS 17886]|nr:Golgi membrane exchange factor (Ric1p-Rgp1p) subunit [Malassezia sp. CBS 17886]
MDDAYASAVVVAVHPKRPSWFAGEQFQCTITFTNTRAGAHTAPSPGIVEARRAASLGSAFVPERPTAPPRRRGLLGAGGAPQDAAPRARAHAPSAAALGLGAPPHRRAHRSYASRSEAWAPAGRADAAGHTSAQYHPPVQRHPPLTSAHPHARQKSIVVYQAEDLSEAFALQPKGRETARMEWGGEGEDGGAAAWGHPGEFPAAEKVVAPFAVHAETPGDPRASRQSQPHPPPTSARRPGAATPTAGPSHARAPPADGHSTQMDDELRDSITTWTREQWGRDEGAAQALAAGFSPGGARATAASPLFPGAAPMPLGHEKLLWTFAQFGGTMEVSRTLVNPADFDALRRRLAAGELTPQTPGQSTAGPAPDATSRMLGGGELGYDTELESASLEMDTGMSPSDLREEHAPSIATIAALLFRYPLSEAYNTHPSTHGRLGRAPHTARHMRSGSTLSDIRMRALRSRTLPTYSTPPTMLAVDMQLAPGESRSYELSLMLPVDLPPSFHGCAVHFDYYLTVGTNRVDRDSDVPHAQQSRLLHIPIRVYNHVAPDVGLVACFDMLNPIIVLQSPASVRRVRDSGERGARGAGARGSAEPHASGGQPGTVEASRALSGVAGARDGAPLAEYIATLLSEDAAHATAGRGDAAPPAGCRDAVMQLTKNAGKISYDIAKDGHIAAVLTLARSKYRLGDTVQAIVCMNAADARVRIVRLTATLESHEEVYAGMATMPAPRAQKRTRQVHATHDELTLDTRQTGIMLQIPSGATPDFSTNGIQHRWTLRVSLLTMSSTAPVDGCATPVQPPPHLAVVPDAYTSFHTAYRGTPSLCGSTRTAPPVTTKLEIVECAVPVTVYPHSSTGAPLPIALVRGWRLFSCVFGFIFSYFCLRGFCFRGFCFRGFCFRGFCFRVLSFFGCRFFGCCFLGCHFLGCRFLGFCLPGFRFLGFRLPGFRFFGFCLPRLRFLGFRLPGCRFLGFCLPGFRFFGFCLPRLRFLGFCLPGFRFLGFCLPRLRFLGFCLPGFRFLGFCLPRLRFLGFRLPGFRFFGCRFPGFCFFGFCLPGFRFFGCRFPGFCFFGFCLPGFRFFGCRFPGFRLPGFRFFDFRLPGFRFLGFCLPGFRLPGFRFFGFCLPGFRFLGCRFLGFCLPGFHCVTALDTGTLEMGSE